MNRFLLSALVALAVAAPVAAADDVVIKAGKEFVEFKVGDTLVGRYHIAPAVAKPYFWPLNGPYGQPITRAWPMEKAKEGESVDHVHQKSFWFCHGDVIPEGMEIKDKVNNVDGVDFWSEHKNAGKIVCVKVGDPKSDKNHAWITTANEWRMVNGTKIMDETRTIHLYAFGDTRLLVFDIDLHASVVPITFGDTKEGSFGVRVHDVLREKGGKGKLENAAGKTSMKAIWGYASGWCDYSGPIEGKTVGIAIFDDPANPHPAYWHSRDYGLMAANPFAREKSGFPGMKGKSDLVKIAKGEHLKLRYGILIHPGDAKEGKVGDHYDKFVKMKK